MSIVIFPPKVAETDLDNDAVEPDDDLGLLEIEDEPFGEDEELDALDNPEADDLVIMEEPDTDPGRSWSFAYESGRYRFSPARGPIETHGEFTLREWIEKCLRTPRGRYPIYSDDYGMENPERGIGEQGEEAFENLEGRISDALTYHPRISEIADFEFELQETVDAELIAVVSFTVILDDDSTLGFDTTLSSGELG